MLALGGFRLEDPDADRALGRGMACELLAFLVARGGSPVSTEAIVEALWLHDPPPTATTMVHSAVARVRRAIGRSALRRDLDGYVLDPAELTIDLWEELGLPASPQRRPGGVTLTEPVLGQYRERSWARPLLRALGIHTEGTASPAADAPATLPATLPATRLASMPLARMVGRRPELVAVRTGLERGRLVTVVGMGGVGKSRLVAEVVMELLGVGAPVVRVDLGRAAGSFAERLATLLDLVADGETGALLLAASAVLDDRAVVVIDACEHDLDGAADGIAFLLQHRPALRVIATSRSALGVPGEQVVPLLPFADAGHPRGDAVEMLLDRLRASGFPLTPADRDRAALLCAACGGVPLAIELVAADFLTTEVPAAASGRPEQLVQERVRDAVGALGGEAATIARRLAMLPRGASTDLLRRLHPGGASAGTRDLLGAAVASIEATPTGRRVHLPDVVVPEVEREVTAADRSAVAAALIDLLGPACYTGAAWPPVPALEAALAEVANLPPVLRVLRQHGHARERLDLALAATGVWYSEGHWLYAVDELVSALESVERAERDDPDDGAAVRRAEVLAAIVDVCGTFSAVVPWVPQLPSAIAAAEAADQRHLVARLRYAEAVGLGYSGRVAESTAAARAARAAAEAAASESLVLRVDGLDAMGRLLAGQAEAAHESLVQTADRCEVLDWPGPGSTALLIAAFAARAAGRPQDALADAERGAEMAARGRLRATRASLLAEIASLRMEVDPASARAALLAAIEMGVPVGQRRMAGVCRLDLGLLDDDLATLARATSELLFADRRWAGAALAQVAIRLPPSHGLARPAGAMVARLLSQGGAPLLAHLEEVAQRVTVDADPELPDEWEDVLQEELLHLAGR